MKDYIILIKDLGRRQVAPWSPRSLTKRDLWFPKGLSSELDHIDGAAGVVGKWVTHAAPSASG
jgi:hypothetical protein